MGRHHQLDENLNERALAMKFILGSFVVYCLARGTLQQYLDLAIVSNQAPISSENPQNSDEGVWWLPKQLQPNSFDRFVWEKFLKPNL
jgi:hypothetical protein